MATNTKVVLKLACIAVLACMLVSSPAVEALTCGQVSGALAPCLSYLTKSTPVTPGCCGGVKNLLGLARTTPDRKTACGCLKSLAGGVGGLNQANAASLPGKCGVNIPYKISPSTDCNKVT